MTFKITTREGFSRALQILADDIDRGLIVSCSIHYEPTHVARLSVVYATGRETESELPRLPGVRIETAETEPG